MVLRAHKVSWKDMAAYFLCERAAYIAHNNKGNIVLEIDTRKSNNEKYFPQILKLKYKDFIIKTKRSWIDGNSYHRLDLEQIIRR